jgi:hypothetical protein
MKETLTIILLFISSFCFSQDSDALYKGLYFNMPIQEAFKEFEENNGDYKDISFGDGVVWRLFKQNLNSVEDKLEGLVLTPQGSTYGMNQDNAKVYLTNSKQFLVSKDYTVFKEPIAWNVPVLFSPSNKTGLVLIDPDQKMVVELRSSEIIGSGTEKLYNVTLTINNYANYMKNIIATEEKNKSEQDKTGF